MLVCTVVPWFLTGTSRHYCNTGNTNSVAASAACVWAPEDVGVIWELELIPL